MRRGHVVGDNGGSRLIVVWEKGAKWWSNVTAIWLVLLRTQFLKPLATEYFSSKFRGMTDRLVFSKTYIKKMFFKFVSH